MARVVQVKHGVVVWNKHSNDYAGGRDKGCVVGGNVRYKRSKPTKTMAGHGYGGKPLS